MKAVTGPILKSTGSQVRNGSGSQEDIKEMEMVPVLKGT
jgi:hypothetical protein